MTYMIDCKHLMTTRKPHKYKDIAMLSARCNGQANISINKAR